MHKEAFKDFGWIFCLEEKMCINRVNMDFLVYDNVEDARNRADPIN